MGQAATGAPLPWPAPESLALKFVAHHLWDPARRDTDPPMACRPRLRRSWEALRLEARAARPLDSQTPVGELGHAASLERAGGSVPRAQSSDSGQAGGPGQHQASAAQEQARSHPQRARPVAPTCRSDRLADTRDRAILLLAFASGGRRRSEVARFRVEQISDEPAVLRDPKDPQSPTLPCVAIQLGRTKTGVADEAGRVLLVGPPVEALREWLERADIARGPIFRAIDRWEAVEEKALTPQSINLIVKRRCVLAGLEPREFSAHGLRSGY